MNVFAVVKYLTLQGNILYFLATKNLKEITPQFQAFVSVAVKSVMSIDSYFFKFGNLL